jgi:hypothetical protein
MDGSNVKEVKVAAAYLLGLHRMEEGVPRLSKIITIEMEWKDARAEGLWGRYPIVEALIRIGMPAVPQMVANIEESTDEQVCTLSAQVIRYVMGPEAARFTLESAMENKAEGVKVRLRKAIATLANDNARN